MKLHRNPQFLRAYRFLPHRTLNRAAKRIGELRRPRWAVQAAIRTWIRKQSIDMTDYEPGPFDTLEAFFLRELRPGARPIGEGFVSPVDGVVFGAGRIERATLLQVKGQPLSLRALVNGHDHDLPLGEYEGGAYATIFLTPSGYHHIHAPCSAELVDSRWVPGRYFPQNEDAIHHIPRIYERNERVTLRLRAEVGEVLMVLVGASLIGGIHLDGYERSEWATPRPMNFQSFVQKGQRIGHFSYGSTVVLLFPRSWPGAPEPTAGALLKMGQPIGD